MSTVKENSLNEHITETAAQLATRFLRLVTDKITGDSELIEIADLFLQVSNTDGLQTLLDGKIPRVALESNHLVKSDDLGGLILAGLDTYTFITEAEMNAITGNGFYVHTGATLVLPLYGTVAYIIVGGGHRVVFSSSGIWHSTYSSGWSVPRYVGGAFDNISVTYAEAAAMVADNQLSPGASYKITDYGNDNGIIIRAASANEFETDGIRLGYIPIAGIWTRIWSTDVALPLATTEIYYYCGRLYHPITLARGTASNWTLDATNWLLLDPATDTEHYELATFGCTYKFVSSIPLTYTKGYVAKQWDDRGNCYGDLVENVDGFRTEYNDWSIEFVAGTYFGNTLRRVYNNSIGDEWTFTNNDGMGDVYNAIECSINENILPDDNNNIRNIRGSILNKNVLGGTADIQYLDSGSAMYDNSINGDVKGDAAVYAVITMSECEVLHGAEIKDLVSGTFSKSIIKGTIDGNKTTSTVIMDGCHIGIDLGSPIITNNGPLVLTRAIIEDGCYIASNTGTTQLVDTKLNQRSHLTGNVDLWMIYSEMRFGAELSNKTFTDMAQVLNSTLASVNASVQTIATNISIHQAQSKITGSFYIGTGTFTIPTGATYNPLTVVTGCAGTTIRENGVTVDAVSDRVIVAKYAGWYRFKYTSSVLCQTINTIAEAIIYVNSSPLQAGYNSKTYTAVDSYINASLSTDLLLAAGDVVSVRYKHNKGTTVTFALGQVNLELEYNN